MASETLHYENARFAQQLFNHEPRNLQALETELGVKATAREGWIKLDGTAEAVERAKQLFSSLQNLLQAGSPVKNREFTHALQVVKHDGATMLKDMVSDRITTHERKPGVTAKTAGQKKYLEAIRKHDITFGIGPAGTGKTYLAVAMALSASANRLKGSSNLATNWSWLLTGSGLTPRMTAPFCWNWAKPSRKSGFS